MISDQQGVLQVPPPRVKEQLHDIPPDYTAVGDLNARTRHRLIGNGWDWGVARKLFTFLVVATWNQTPAAAFACPPTAPSGFRPSTSSHHGGAPADHHPLPPNMAPRPRPHPASVMQELREMVDDFAATSSRSGARLTRNARHKTSSSCTYWRSSATRTSPASGRTSNKVSECWANYAPDQVGRYAHPRPLHELRELNSRYVRQKTASARVGEHTEQLLKELMDETRLGRVIGPARAPAHWTRATVAMPHHVHMDRLVDYLRAMCSRPSRSPSCRRMRMETSSCAGARTGDGRHTTGGRRPHPPFCGRLHGHRPSYGEGPQ